MTTTTARQVDGVDIPDEPLPPQEPPPPGEPAPKRRRTFSRPAPTPAPLSPLDAMIAKLPDFDPAWPPAVQEAWLSAYNAILIKLLER